MHLDGPDAGPTRSSCGVGWPAERDPYDWSFVVAKDSGSGVIQHIWAQLENQVDSLTQLRIWVDDSLIITSPLYTFFKKVHGPFRAPLDSLASGAMVCDVQIPYKRNFRITYFADYTVCCLFWAVTWRPMPAQTISESFSLNPSATLAQQQKEGEAAYSNHNSPWTQENSQVISLSKKLYRGDTLVLADITGPSLINTLHFQLSNYDTSVIKALELEMFWDDNPKPSVKVPLADFFCAGAGVKPMTAFPLHTSVSSGFSSYFPMPFAHHGLIRLIASNKDSVSVLSEIHFTKEPIDRTKDGYFHTEFHASLPTYNGVFHPVANILGRGRFVGLTLTVPDAPVPYYLEGDPYFTVDSSSLYSFRYTGTEDYFNGGWFFEDGSYSLPFAGCTALWSSLYRFHYFDALDFEKSFQLKFQHGPRNDLQVNFRTVAYYYKRRTPFWVSRDTICKNNDKNITITGSGYLPDQTINCTLGGRLLFTTKCNATGTFSYRFEQITSLPLGLHFISIDGDTSPQPILIIDNPQVYFVRDPLPQEIRWNDTLLIYGSGFKPGEQITFRIGNTPIDPINPCYTDSNFGFKSILKLPWLDNGQYQVQAIGTLGSTAVTESSLTVTRSLNYECESLWPPTYVDANAGIDYMVYFEKRWSNQTYVRFEPHEAGKKMQLGFEVPFTDTFSVEVYATKGLRFGTYNVSIDKERPVRFEGFEDRDINDPIRSNALPLGNMYLSKGFHILTFDLLGKATSSKDYLLGADNLILTPVTAFTTTSLGVDSVRYSTQYSLLNPQLLSIFPNPNWGKELNIMLDVPLQSQDSGCYLSISIADLFGRTLTELPVEHLQIKRFRTTLSIGNLPSGVYYCIITLRKGSEIERILRPIRITK